MQKKGILHQYRYLLKEKEDVERRISHIKKQIDRIESDGTVKDRVKGGAGGNVPFNIEGFPFHNYSQKKTKLQSDLLHYRDCEDQIEELSKQALDIIKSISFSRDRVICRYFFLDGRTQQDIALEMCMDQSTVSKILSKYEK